MKHNGDNNYGTRNKGNKCNSFLTDNTKDTPMFGSWYHCLEPQGTWYQSSELMLYHYDHLGYKKLLFLILRSEHNGTIRV